MSVRRLAPPELQPASFALTAENLAWAKQQIAKYPEGRQASAVIPILWRAQEQAGGWTSRKAIEYVADLLGMAHIRVLEVATFYTMFLLEPVGRKAHVQWCGTTPCLLRGGEEIKQVCQRRIHHDPFHVSADGDFSWEEVECLGACVNAPMVLIGKDTYEDLTAESFEKVLDAIARGETPKPGPQNGRQYSAPLGGDTTLKNIEVKNIAVAPPAPIVAPAPAVVAPLEPELPPVAAAPAAVAAPEPQLPPVAASAALPDAAPAVPDAPAAPAEPPSAPVTFAAAEEAEIAAKLSTLPKDATAEDKANAVGSRPHALPAARDGNKDNLQRIKGIGRVNETKLNALGVFHFDQIAQWTRPEIRWVGTYLAFPGRIDRENWVSQAAALAAGSDNPMKPGKA